MGALYLLSASARVEWHWVRHRRMWTWSLDGLHAIGMHVDAARTWAHERSGVHLTNASSALAASNPVVPLVSG